MPLKLNLDPPKKETSIISYEEAQKGLLRLGFNSTRSARSARKQTDAFKGKYEFKEGHVVRELAFYHCQYHGRSFHSIQQEPERFFAVHVYYTRLGEVFEDLEKIHKPTPNALLIIHDHPINRHCIPISRCKELIWIP